MGEGKKQQQPRGCARLQTHWGLLCLLNAWRSIGVEWGTEAGWDRPTATQRRIQAPNRRGSLNASRSPGVGCIARGDTGSTLACSLQPWTTSLSANNKQQRVPANAKIKYEARCTLCLCGAVPDHAGPGQLTFRMSDPLGYSMSALPIVAPRHSPCSAAAVTKRSILGWHGGPAGPGCKLLIADYPPIPPQMVGSSSSARLAGSAETPAAGGGAARRRRWIDAGQEPDIRHYHHQHHIVYTHNKPV